MESGLDDFGDVSTADLSVIDEGCHGGQAGLYALVPRQYILHIVVQEFVQDPTKINRLMRRAVPKPRYQEEKTMVPENGKLDSSVGSVLLHQPDKVLVGAPTFSYLHNKQQEVKNGYSVKTLPLRWGEMLLTVCSKIFTSYSRFFKKKHSLKQKNKPMNQDLLRNKSEFANK